MSKGVSPTGRVSYPHLFVPQKQTDDAGNTKEDYSVVLMLGKDDPELAKMKEVAKKVAAEKWPKGTPSNAKSPFRDGDEKNENGDKPEYAGTVYITFRCKVDRKPQVVGPDKSPLNREDVYPGCYGRVSYSCFAYEIKNNKGAVISRGVSFGLNNFQKVRDGERLDSASSADDDFDLLEDAKSSSSSDMF